MRSCYWLSSESEKDIGSGKQVSPDLLMKIPVSGIDQALQGRVPRSSGYTKYGAPGEGVSVRIRGVVQSTSNNQPLYIIDGSQH